MDYKKKYEEAIIKLKKLFDRANNNHETLDLWFNNFANIFPELRESEDERIRQEIVSYLNQFREEGLRGVDINPWIAYLEKQKEQKPVYWSAYDKATLEYIIEDIKDLRNDESDDETISTLDRELHLLECINESTKLSTYTNPEEQKPAEWSEEDEKMLKALIHNQEILIDSASNEQLRDIYSKEIQWLESLRPLPHWKPTEEQMKALEIACNLTDDAREHIMLSSLYEQLKSL